MLSALGTRMTNFALSIWAWEVTGRATDLTLMLAFSFIPTVLFSPIAGVLIDRWNRRLTVVLSDVGSAVATGALLLMFLLGPVHMWQVYAVNFVTGAFLAFQLPAYFSTITLMVERGRYPRANAMMFVVRFAPVVFAPALAAALLATSGIRFILLVDTVSYVVAIGAVFLVNMPQTPRLDGESPIGVWRDSFSGFRYLLHRRPLAGFEAILFTINLFASIGFVLLVPLVLARTGNDSAQAGIVATIGAIGGALGAVLLGVLNPTPHKMLRILVAILVFSVVGRVVYGVGQVLALWAIAMFFVHLCIPFIDGYAQSIWQEKVEPAMQGRVFAARQFIEDLTVPIAALIAGPAVDHFFEPWMRSDAPGGTLFGWLVGTGPGAGMGLVFVIVGVLGVGVALIGFAAPNIRRIETVLPDAVVPDVAVPDVAVPEGAWAETATPAVPPTLAVPATVGSGPLADDSFSHTARAGNGSTRALVEGSTTTMTQHVDKLDTPVPGPGALVEETRTPGVVTPATRSRWHRQAMVIFAVATIAYVAFKLPPYLSFDPRNSQIPLEHSLHFALLTGHVISGSIALLTAALQLWPWLRRKAPAVHRISGRFYIFAGALPSAVLAITMYPVTPGAGRVSVVAAATLWSTTAILGWIAARRKRFAEHRRWMVYSFAIMWGYGVWVFVLANAFYYGLGVDVATAMEAARWGGWTGNLLIAHWWLERTAGRTIIGTPRRSPKLKKAAGTDSRASAVQPAPTTAVS